MTVVIDIVIIISYIDSKSNNVVKSCNEVKIYSIGNNGWKSIEKFSANIPSLPDYGIYFNTNIIWLTTTNEFDRSQYIFDVFVVVFLDL
ncbi:hypothetical protein VIGAN_04090700 [Vigna angularis var. angularis]|uniref:Uncharacterized protein n=1 Tax=Vigna angularis var. angularis TaxID=157739 RepID=A0A0S3RTC1_PHAAN|nr:hypothetical protein VIGAN_04090700 [Vigna angularis var. angularis]